MQTPETDFKTLDILGIWLGFFMGWTVGSVPLTLISASFGTLWIAFIAGLVGAFLGWRSRALLGAIFFVKPEPVQIIRSPSRVDLLVIVGTVIGVLGTTAFFIPTNDARPLWAVVLFSVLLVLWRTPAIRAEDPMRWSEPYAPSLISVLILALVLWLAYVFILRPDADDAFYLNLPMGIATAAHGMLAWDTMYGMAEWPVLGSNYKVEALQTLIAAVAWASGLSVVIVAHLVLPTIWCLIWAATLAVIGTSLFGRKWWVFAILSILSTFMFAGTLQNWGVHGLSRLFHGKAPLILIIVPLIFILTYRADSLNVPLHKVIPVQAGLIIVAVGLTANAIYIGPLVLGLAVCASWIMRGFRSPQRLWVLIAVVPAVIAGLWLLVFDTPVTVPPDENRIFIHLGMWNMFPNKVLLGLMAVTVLIGILAGIIVPQARFVTACLSGVLLFVLNPFLWPMYDGFVTGGLNFRLWWAVPVPFLFSIFLAWSVILFYRLVWPFPVIVAALSTLSFAQGGLFGMSETQLALSPTKRPAEQSEVAQQVIVISQGRKVLAVESISAWLPTFENHPPQVYIRKIYLDHNMTVVAATKLEPHSILANWVNADSEMGLENLSEALTRQCPEIIVVSKKTPPHEFEEFTHHYYVNLIVETYNYQIYEISVC